MIRPVAFTAVAHGLLNQIQRVVHRGVQLPKIRNATVSGCVLFGNPYSAFARPTSMPVLYHNPRCSKSRQALQFLLERNVDVDIRLYLKTPLDYDTLHDLLSRLVGDIHLAVRSNDKAFKALDTSAVDFANIEDVARFLSENAQCIERPWFDDGTNSIIARPVENLAPYV